MPGGPTAVIAPKPARAAERSPPASVAAAPRAVPIPGAVSFALRLGDSVVEVPVQPHPDGTLRGDLAGLGLLIGGVALTDLHLATAEDGSPVEGWAGGPVQAPFVHGLARFAVAADGSPTGAVALEATVRVAGTALAQLSYPEPLGAPAAGVPGPLILPDVSVEAGSVQLVFPAAPADRQLLIDTGTGPAPARTPLTLPLPAATEGGGIAPESVTGSIGVPLEPSAAQRLSTLLGQAVGQLLVHSDPATAMAAEQLPGGGFTAGNELFFGHQRYAPDTAVGFDLLARMVTQALAGLAGPARTAQELADPAAESAVAVPAAPAAPAIGLPQTPAGALEAVAPVGTEPPLEQPAAPAAAAAAVEAAGPAAGAGAAGAPADSAALPEGEAPPVAEVELLIAPAPAEPPPAQAERIQGAAARGGGAAGSAAALPPAAESTAAARGAVTEPTAETAARAEADLAEALGARAEPSPEIVALCEHIRTSIREGRPANEGQLVDADPQGIAQQAGSQLDSAVQSDTDAVGAAYDPLQTEPTGSPEQIGTPITPPPTGVADPGIDAPSASPDPIPAEDVSLDADRAAVDQQVADARMERTSTEPITDDPFATVRQGQAELAELSGPGPAEVLAGQDEALAAARADMAGLQARALEALNASRSGTVASTATQQTGMVGSEVATRESVSAQARGIFDGAQTQVDTLLQPLTQTALATWNAGVQRHSTEFRQSLDQVKAWIEERHDGVTGWFVEGWDALTGLPGWVVESYDAAERLFGDRICELLLEISADVNSVVAAAEAIIEDARTRIDTLFSSLPVELQEWAAEQQASFGAQLDGLNARVTETRTSFTRDLTERALSAVAEVQAEVEALRDEARGVIGRVVDAINAFIEDPVKAIIDGLLSLVGIPPPAFWALVARIQQVVADIAEDPMNFVNNLVAGLKLGFEQFFAAFPEHLLQGFFDWLFSGLGSVGVQVPADFSLNSVITFALQLMGITWPVIRGILVNHIGEENVALIEQAWQLVSTLIEQGPEGILEMLRSRLDPATLLQQILDAAISYVVQTLIEQVAIRIIGLLNPAGAVVQAIQLIYTVLVWLFNNAARIFRMVEAVVGGIADIVAGNISGTAAVVEAALASMLPIVIDFLAGFLGLGDLPERVADIIRGLQAYVYGILDAVIGWLVEQGRALLAALGFGEEGEEAGEDGNGSADTELGREVSFSGGDESHRQWIDTSGGGATLMVASTPTTVEAKLNDWSGRLHEARDPAEAGALLGNARTLLGQADATADELAAAYAAARDIAAASEQGEQPPSDDPLEAKQQALSTILGRLFDLFGELSEALALQKIAEAMPAHAAAFVGVVHPSWWDTYISTVQLGGEETSPPLWQRTDINGTQSGALSQARNPSFQLPLTPYFTEAPGKREATTQAFYDHVFTGASDSKRSFLTALGMPVPAALRSVGTSRVTASDAGQTWKDRMLGKLGEIAYDVSITPYGRLELPTERIPDHSRFRPEAMTITDQPGGGRIIRYTTVSGQSFVITEPSLTSGLATQVEGSGLRIMTGRGITQDSPHFIPGQNLNRAHIIANQFGGSGYRNSGNLATTSAQYNQVTMRAAEIEIINRLIGFAESHQADVEDVTFDLTVSVSFGALIDQSVFDLIKAQPDYPPNAPELTQYFTAKIAAVVTSPLRRVTQVVYSWAASLPSGASTNGSLPPIGPDLWLLIDW